MAIGNQWLLGVRRGKLPTQTLPTPFLQAVHFVAVSMKREKSSSIVFVYVDAALDFARFLDLALGPPKPRSWILCGPSYPSKQLSACAG